MSYFQIILTLKNWTTLNSSGRCSCSGGYIAIELNDEAKAYPLSILMFHEIVNDELGGEALAITYCPLCNAAMVFDRKLVIKGDTTILDFGVSGMLRNSDMVMYDRQTES